MSCADLFFLEAIVTCSVVEDIIKLLKKTKAAQSAEEGASVNFKAFPKSYI